MKVTCFRTVDSLLCCLYLTHIPVDLTFCRIFNEKCFSFFPVSDTVMNARMHEKATQSGIAVQLVSHGNGKGDLSYMK